MSGKELTAVLGGWEGYTLGTVGRFEAGEGGRTRAEVHLELLPLRDHPRTCFGCGKPCRSIHDTAGRRDDGLPILGADTRLLVHRVRVACPDCGGPKLERPGWLEPYARVTARLAESVARLCRVLPVKHVADYFTLNWKTVTRIDKAYLGRTLGPVGLDGGHEAGDGRVRDPEGPPLRHGGDRPDVQTRAVGRTGARARRRAAVLRAARPRAVRADRGSGDGHERRHDLEVKRHCPGAEVVYDLFHVVAKYGREVVDRVRVDEANRVRHDKPARKVIKGSRWLLLRNRENIEREADRVRLDEPLAADRKPMTVYVLKDDLRELWDYRHTGYATSPIATLLIKVLALARAVNWSSIPSEPLETAIGRRWRGG